MLDPKQRDLYDDVYPTSWFALCPADALKKGGIRDVEAFGHKLVVYRTESGALHVSERFCPHMGASLGQGHVKGECIVCPFHHWHFGADGKCAKIPYMEDARIPKLAVIKKWPVREHVGWIWIFNGETPTFDIPDLPEARDPGYGVRFKTQLFEMHPLLLLENGCDAQHFKYIHKVNFQRYDVEMLQEDAMNFAFAVHQEVKAPTGTIMLRTTIHYVGGGTIFGALHHKDQQTCRFIAAPLPIGNKRTLFHLIVFVKRLPWPLRLFDPLYLRFFAGQLFRGSTDDYLPIWKHMDPSHRGVLVEEDRLQQRFRKYYQTHLP